MVAFWVFYDARPDAHHTRCCAKTSFDPTGGWLPKEGNYSGGFYRLADYRSEKRLCVDYLVSQVQSKVENSR